MIGVSSDGLLEQLDGAGLREVGVLDDLADDQPGAKLSQHYLY